MRKPRVFLAVAIAALLAFTGLLTAHAANLLLTSASLDGFSYRHPCPVSATLAPASAGTKLSEVTVTLASGACNGQTLDVTLTDATGKTLATGRGTVAGSKLRVPVAPFTAVTGMRARVTAASWALAASWETPAPPTPPTPPADPVAPGTSGTQIAAITWTLVSNNPVQACFDASVTTASKTPIPWKLVVNLAAAPFNGVAPSRFVLQGTDGWRYQVAPGTGQQLTVTGKPGNGRESVVVGQRHTVSVCHYELPPAVQAPGAYTQVDTRGIWTDQKACITTTITGNGTQRFYFAWTAKLNMASAVARIEASGRKVDAYTYGASEWTLTRAADPAGGKHAFTVTSKSESDIAGTSSTSFSTCAVSWE